MLRSLFTILFIATLAAPDYVDAKPIRTQITSALKSAIVQSLQNPDATIQIQSWKASDKQALTAAKRLISLRILPGERPYGKVTAQATLKGRSESQTVFVVAKVQVNIPVWVAKRRIASGAPINEYNVVQERRPLRSLASNVMPSSTALVGRVAARSIQPGSILTMRSTTTPRLIRSGETVAVIVKVGPVSVRAEGKAMASGRRGERIRVRLHSNRHVVSGRVISRGKVEVQR
jgi:flagella basal body P-ring formation protein FlgA